LQLSIRPVAIALLMHLGLCLGPAVALATQSPADAAADEAVTALALGKTREGLERLRDALKLESKPSTRCLLGLAQLRHGDLEGATQTLEGVPRTAPCGAQAAFTRADALLGLKRADAAAALYDEAGAPALGPDRDATLATELVGLAQAVVDDPDGSREQAAELLNLALGLRIAPARRLEIAERLAEMGATAVRTEARPVSLTEAAERGLSLPAGDSNSAAAVALGIGLSAPGGDTPERRLAYARLARAADGLSALDAIALPTAEVRLARAQLVFSADPDVATAWREALLSAKDDAHGAVSKRALPLQAAALAQARRLTAVRPLLQTLAAGDDELAADAAWQEFELLSAGQHARSEEAIAALETFVRRFPAAAEQRDAETHMSGLRLGRARALAARGETARALAIYGQAAAAPDRSEAPSQAVYESGLVARAAGDRADALRRWRMVLSRWPDAPAAVSALTALARSMAFDENDPAGADLFLREAEKRAPTASAAAMERARRAEPSLTVQSPGRQSPNGQVKVRVVARNLPELEVRMHRVEPEAYVRAGGTPQDLLTLDVAVIVPDARWKAPVPGYQAQRDQAFDLPVNVPGPGIYVVTVSGTEQEASAVLLVSDLDLVARTVGPDAALAVFRGGRPVSGAKLLLGAGGVFRRAETDRRGLYVGPVAAGKLSILAMDDGSPALLTLDRQEATLPASTVAASADLDRPAYRPGDVVGFRLMLRKGGLPVPGPWKVWLVEGSTEHSPVVLTPGREGSVTGELPIPPVALGVGAAHFTLRAQAVGADAPLDVARVLVAPEVAAPRRVRVDLDPGTGQDATVSVLTPDGRPVAGEAVEWRSEPFGPEGSGRTDAAGRVRVEGPPAGLPWTLSASLRGTPVSGANSRVGPAFGQLALSLGDERLLPGERPELTVRGPVGPVRVTLSRLTVVKPEVPPPLDPWVPMLDLVFHGPLTWTSVAPPAPETTIEEELWREDTSLDGTPVDGIALRKLAPPAVDAGMYVLRVTALDGRASTSTLQFDAAPNALRLRGVRNARVGETLKLTLEGQPSLVTVESERLLHAAILRPGEATDLAILPGWGGVATMAATTAEGQVHARNVEIDGTLNVTLEARQDAGVVSAQVRVTDGAGRPVEAEVVISAVDEALVDLVGPPPLLESGPLGRPVLPVPPVGGVAHAFGNGGEARAVSAALREEEGRAQEARRAARAESGRLTDNAVAAQMESKIILAQPSVGLGAVGTGAGGGGRGDGMGKSASKRMGSVSPVSRGLTGERGRVLFVVARTDGDGRVSAVAPLPPGRRTLRLFARALSGEAVGGTDRLVLPSAKPDLVLPVVAGGAPGDRVTLRATVVNPGEKPLTATIRAGAVSFPAQVSPGAALDVDLGPVRAGESAEVVLAEGERVLSSGRMVFPLAAGEPDLAGTVLVVAAGPGGGPPLGYLALSMGQGPGLDATRAARAGRAALAALPRALANSPEATLLTQRVGSMRAFLRTRAPDDLEGAVEVLRFLTEGRKMLGVVRGELETAGQAVTSALPQAPDAAARVAALHALAVADLTFDEGALERALKDAATLPDESAARLADIQRHKGKANEARALLRGAGPFALLVARALGDKAPSKAWATSPPPGVDDPTRPDFIAALALIDARPKAPKGAPKATVKVGGAVRGELDLATGGALRLTTDGGATPAVAVDGAPGALVWREAPVRAGSGVVTGRGGLRIPRGRSGAPVDASVTTSGPTARLTDAALCGTEAAPCRLAVGDALRVAADLDTPGFRGVGGLTVETEPVSGARRLVARTPGLFTLSGLRVATDDGGFAWAAPLRVEVLPTEAGASPLAPDEAMAMTVEASHADEDPIAALSSRKSAGAAAIDAWPTPLRATFAQLLFSHALKAKLPPAELVERFERLRELQPEARLEFENIVTVARAYRAVGRPERAVAVWRAGLGAAFLAEAGGARGLEGVGGLLASVQVVRGVLGRYPALPVVAETRFHLPERLGSLADETLPEEVVKARITATDLRLMAAAWDREFLALEAESPRAAEAGFHLVEGLMRLRAFGQAARWARNLAQRHPEAPVLDGLLYMEGMALSEMGDENDALKRFARIAEDEFPQADGSRGPAETREDARFAAARLLEARGDLDGARKAYAELTERAEAVSALRALSDIKLTAQPLMRQRPSEAGRIKVTLANLDEVHLRVYRLDLRTIFLRDQGLDRVLEIQISGVSPTWAGARDVSRSPFPHEVFLDVPVKGAGAYLVQIDGGGQETATLLLRSDLEMAVDSGEETRVQVRWRDGKPARAVELRALGGGATALRADLRGVAMLPGAQAVLAFDGEHYAFADIDGGSPDEDRKEPARPPRAAPAKSMDMMDNIDQRMKQQRSRNQEDYEQQFEAAPDQSIEVQGL